MICDLYGSAAFLDVDITNTQVQVVQVELQLERRRGGYISLPSSVGHRHRALGSRLQTISLKARGVGARGGGSAFGTLHTLTLRIELFNVGN